MSRAGKKLIGAAKQARQVARALHPISNTQRDFVRAAFRIQISALLLTCLSAAARNGTTDAMVAARLGWPLETLRQRITDPSGLTLDIISDIAFACDGAEVHWSVQMRPLSAAPEEGGAS